jgi:hypothetical protein
MKRPVLPIIIALAIAAALAYSVWSISAPDANSRALAFSLALGAVFGAVLQRSRFCFFCCRPPRTSGRLARYSRSERSPLGSEWRCRGRASQRISTGWAKGRRLRRSR